MHLQADLFPALLSVMSDAVSATNTMAQIGASGTTSNGVVENPLPSQYIANIGEYLFNDTNKVTQVQRESSLGFFSTPKSYPSEKF